VSAETKARAIGWLLLGASIVLSAAGQLAMKTGMLALHVSQQAGGAAVINAAVWWTFGGLAAYACSMLSWLGVLVRYPLSYAYPMLGLSYALVYAGATHWSVLHEPATPLRTAGTLLIIAGVALVTASGARDGATGGREEPPAQL
jgi:undecaprenyl phosphate-alpha-L-ara4N flippase subunit ArnF